MVDVIGKLRHQISLLKPIIIKDELGQEVEKLEVQKTIWVSIEPLSGKEYFSAKQVNSEATVKITIRYIESLLPHWVVQFGQRIFNIEAIINLEERNRYLQLLCSEKVGETND